MFLKSEIGKGIEELKLEKCFGSDGIKAEMLKLGTNEVTESMTYLFNQVLEREEIPKQWKESSIILLHKKGEKTNINNYRPLSIISIIYKVFAKCLFQRMKTNMNETQPREQAGFRSGFATSDHLQSINQVMEKFSEYQKGLYITFIDFYKAFDTIEHIKIWTALSKQGVSHKIISILAELYKNNTAKIKTEIEGKTFKIERGVRQGDPISPSLFTAVLEEVFRNLNIDNLGLNIDGEILTNLRFADDIALFASSSDEMCEMIKQLAEGCKNIGLEINEQKTKVMTNANQNEIRLEGQKIEYVEDYIYLGQLLSFRNKQDKEIARRVANGWKKFWSLKNILDSNIGSQTRKYLYDMAILPVMTYGAQTWSMNERLNQKLQVNQRAMERSLLKITRLQRITNERVRKRTNFEDIIKKAKILKWQWAGHLARMTDNRWTKRTTEWTPRDGTRRVGRQVKRWRDELHKYDSRWERTARDRKQWQILGEAYAQDN